MSGEAKDTLPGNPSGAIQDHCEDEQRELVVVEEEDEETTEERSRLMT